MSKFRLAQRLVSEYRYSPAVLFVLWKRIRTGTLPNTRQANRAVWGSRDWSAGGEEWSNDHIAGWKQSIVHKLLLPFVDEELVVVEIGPGAGRWTEYLISHARRLILVDVTPECIDLCREKFSAHHNIEYHVNEGNDLGFIEPASIDRIWSFDVFVHILADDVDKYVSEFARILVPGGRALIHHSKVGFTSGAWRSDMTDVRMRQMAEKYGLVLIEQSESWGGGIERFTPDRPTVDNTDIISVLGKPA